MSSGAFLLAFVTVQRLVELWFARRNTRDLLAHGGIEFGARFYIVIVVEHVVWLAGLWVLGADRPLDPTFFAVFAVLQVARYWVLLTLGRRWTMRVIVVPGERKVAGGPYRIMRHPNYLVAILETAVVPLALGLPLYAAVFFALNAVTLAIKIRIENAALRRAA